MKILFSLFLITTLNTNIMAFEIRTEILIHAKPEKVWAIFTNFKNYPIWNPFIKSLTGTVKVGNKIAVFLQQPDSKGMTFKPKVLAYKENKEFRWLGHLLIPGIFDGEHQFKLIDNGDGTTTFIQSERFRGILVPFLKKQLQTNTKNGFQEMNEKLKELVEKS